MAFVMHDYGDSPVTANPFYGHILSSTEQVCREKHISLSFVIVHHDHSLSDMLPQVLTHDADGILLASPYPPPLIRRISRESSCPIVLIDNFFPGCLHDTVMADDFGGTHQIVSHLIELGHTDIAMLAGSAQNLDIIPSFQERYRGYTTVCAESGITPKAPIVVPARVDPHPESDIETMMTWVKNLFEQQPELTAFFGVSDRFAIAFMAALRKLNIRVPDKISVVGFDDVPESAATRPPLTTIHSHRDLMAKLAVKRLLARIDGDDTPPQYITIGTELMLRNSTGPAPILSERTKA
jgi:DNA-binding LacI/PurR family transcriptional regulator